MTNDRLKNLLNNMDPAMLAALEARVRNETPDHVWAERKARAAAWARFRTQALERRAGLTFAHGAHDPSGEAIAKMLDRSLPTEAPQTWDRDTGFAATCTASEIEAVTAAMERGERAAHPIPIMLGTRPMGSKCRHCDRDMIYRFDGLTFTASPCPLTDTPFVLRFNTAGTLVFKDNLRNLAFPTAVDEERSVRETVTGDSGSFCTLAQQAVARMHAQRGLIAISVGNSCPNVYRLPETDGRNRFQIARDGTSWDELGLGADETFPPEGERLFQVVTDLWLCCFMDLKAYLAAGGAMDSGMHVLEVQPGSYEVRVSCYERPFQCDVPRTPTTYATFERVA